jgi:phage-related protein (TIGR01555 family)
MPRYSVKSAARRVRTEDRQLAKQVSRQATRDSFQNFALGLGIGTNNASSANTYGFHPISRERTKLEWMYRGTWLAGAGVDIIADDMTREGVEVTGKLKPDDISAIEELATTLRIWPRIGQTVKWSRLYGGCIAVLLIDGQDYSKPLRIETVGPNQFQGVMVLDRWMVYPSLEDLVTEVGPNMGLPKFYTVEGLAPALRGQKIHYSRCLRLVGDELPYWQALSENMWGMSVLERPFSIISQFDAATAGVSQLVQKAYLRYLKVDRYREILGGAGGAQAFKGLTEMVQQMRYMASNEGISILDSKDDVANAQVTAFSGIAEAMLQIVQQISGDWQIPLVRLLGQSPSGLNSSGDSEMKTYAGGIGQRQQYIKPMVTLIYRCIAQSLRLDVGQGFGITFRPLWQMDEPAKAEVASKDTATVMEVQSSGLISDQTALRELQSIGKRTGRWNSITDEEVDAASDEIAPKGEPLDGPPLPDAVKPDAVPEPTNEDAPNQ